MADTSWYLGENDPGAGDLAAIHTIQYNLGAVASAAHTAHHDLEALRHSFSDAIWNGQAADKFRDQLSGSFLSKVQKLDQSYQAAADGFSQYLAAVSDIKGEAEPLLVRIGTAQSRYEAATTQLASWVNNANASQLTEHWRTEGSLTAPAPREGSALLALSGAADPVIRSPRSQPSAHQSPPTHPRPIAQQQEVNDAWNEMQVLYRRMLELQDRRRHADDAVRGTLHNAHDLGVKNDSGWHKVWRTMSTIAKWAAFAFIVVVVVVALVAMCVGTDGAFLPFLCEALSWGGGAAAEAGGSAAMFFGYAGNAAQLLNVGYSALSLASNIGRGGSIWNDVFAGFGLVSGAGIVLKAPGAIRLLGGFAARAAAGRGVAASWVARIPEVTPTMIKGAATFGSPTFSSPIALALAIGGKVPAVLSLFGVKLDPRAYLGGDYLMLGPSAPGLTVDGSRITDDTRGLSPAGQAKARRISLALARGQFRVPGSPRTYDYPAMAPA